MFVCNLILIEDLKEDNCISETKLLGTKLIEINMTFIKNGY